MAAGHQSRVAKVESEITWGNFISQAKNQGCPAVVVHFTASWCMPSVAMNSHFEELALRHQDFVFLVVDVDDIKGFNNDSGVILTTVLEPLLKEVASKMEIKAMPTFLLIKDGVVVDRLIGANPDEIQKRAGWLKNY